MLLSSSHSLQGVGAALLGDFGSLLAVYVTQLVTGVESPRVVMRLAGVMVPASWH
jgi:hypothetical protein